MSCIYVNGLVRVGRWRNLFYEYRSAVLIKSRECFKSQVKCYGLEKGFYVWRVCGVLEIKQNEMWDRAVVLSWYMLPSPGPILAPSIPITHRRPIEIPTHGAPSPLIISCFCPNSVTSFPACAAIESHPLACSGVTTGVEGQTQSPLDKLIRESLIWGNVDRRQIFEDET